MNAIFVAIVALGSFYMAYRFYGRFLSKKIFNLQEERRSRKAKYDYRPK